MNAAYLANPSSWTVSRSTGFPLERMNRTVESACP